jgi:hypothetical protein
VADECINLKKDEITLREIKLKSANDAIRKGLEDNQNLEKQLLRLKA